MGWFEEQVKQRQLNDADALADSVINMVGAVLGNRAYTNLQDERLIAQNALDEILKYFHIRSKQIPDSMRTLEERIEYLVRPNGIMYRVVKLESGWSKDCIGPLLLTRVSDGQIVAMIPDAYKGYHYVDTTTGALCKLDEKAEEQFEKEAYCFYKPLPLRKLTIKDLMVHAWSCFSAMDVVLIVAVALVLMLLGMLFPYLYYFLLSNVSNTMDSGAIVATALFFLSVIVSRSVFTIIQSLLLGRIRMKMGLYTESAIMMRLISLPTDFFRNYAAGDLATRVHFIPLFCEQMTETVFSLALPAVFSIGYLFEMQAFSSEMIPACLWMIVLMLVISLLTFFSKVRIGIKRFGLNMQVAGMSYALFSGIQKIKLSGAEKRAFARWGNLYAKEAALTYNPPILNKIGTVLVTLVPFVSSVFIYYYAWSTGIDANSYFTITILLGMIIGAFTPFSMVLIALGDIFPILHMIKPILETEPEISEGKNVINRLRGGFELSHVYFRYDESMPYILNDFSLKVNPGQYVAIVGESGCGKTTLLRLLLGFETPSKGAVYFDGKDIKSIDLKSLRSNMGVVLQNSKLFLGDILSNIRISKPHLSIEDVWKAAEMAGIADDIRSMPMGMFTIIGEGIGGVSGGQAQRIMIARAVAGNPNILFFDEATSALDNITQRNVTEALSTLQCTRVVIAHRLSTIKDCDRIVLLRDGVIAEDGTYEELIRKNGHFARLVEAQMIE